MPRSNIIEFNSLGDLLDPNCPIAAAARERARLEQQERERVELLIAERDAWFKMRALMTPEEIEEMRDGWAGYGADDEPLWVDYTEE